MNTQIDNRHHHRQIQIFRIAFDGSVALPGSMVIGVTMQEVKGAKFLSWFIFRIHQWALWKQNIHRTKPTKCFRKEIQFIEDHNISIMSHLHLRQVQVLRGAAVDYTRLPPQKRQWGVIPKPDRLIMAC